MAGVTRQKGSVVFEKDFFVPPRVALGDGTGLCSNHTGQEFKWKRDNSLLIQVAARM